MGDVEFRRGTPDDLAHLMSQMCPQRTQGRTQAQFSQTNSCPHIPPVSVFRLPPKAPSHDFFGWFRRGVEAEAKTTILWGYLPSPWLSCFMRSSNDQLGSH